MQDCWESQQHENDMMNMQDCREYRQHGSLSLDVMLCVTCLNDEVLVGSTTAGNGLS